MVKRGHFEVLRKKSSTIPLVVWAEESKNGLRFLIGPSYDGLPTRSQCPSGGQSSCTPVPLPILPWRQGCKLVWQFFRTRIASALHTQPLTPQILCPDTKMQILLVPFRKSFLLPSTRHTDITSCFFLVCTLLTVSLANNRSFSHFSTFFLNKFIIFCKNFVSSYAKRPMLPLVFR